MDARCHLLCQLRHAKQPQPVPHRDGATQSHTTDGQLLSDAVWTYQYDGEGMLIAANKTGVAASFKYDPFSRLIERTVNTNKTRYVYAGSRLLEEYDSATNTLLKRYVYAGTDEAVIEIDGAGNVTYLHQDHQNSLIARATGAGTLTAKYEYSPWGEASLPGTGFGYTGQRWDADLGLYNYKARYYDPVKGRFLQPDPVGYKQDMNLYTYCVNDPVNMSDPEGMEAFKVKSLLWDKHESYLEMLSKPRGHLENGLGALAMIPGAGPAGRALAKADAAAAQAALPAVEGSLAAGYKALLSKIFNPTHGNSGGSTASQVVYQISGKAAGELEGAIVPINVGVSSLARGNKRIGEKIGALMDKGFSIADHKILQTIPAGEGARATAYALERSLIMEGKKKGILNGNPVNH